MKKLFAILLTVSLIFNSLSVVYADAEKYTNKIDPELRAVMDESSNSDTIPVCIWIKDIDYSEIETKTYKRTGFNKDSFVVNDLGLSSVLADEIISTTTALSEVTRTNNNIENYPGQDKKETLLSKYLKDTENERTIQLQNVQKYIATKRSIARDAYNQQNQSFVSNYLKDKM